MPPRRNFPSRRPDDHLGTTKSAGHLLPSKRHNLCPITLRASAFQAQIFTDHCEERNHLALMFLLSDIPEGSGLISQ
jgi:hypothetical protein